jgi:hypothetical protein
MCQTRIPSRMRAASCKSIQTCLAAERHQHVCSHVAWDVVGSMALGQAATRKGGRIMFAKLYFKNGPCSSFQSSRYHA